MDLYFYLALYAVLCIISGVWSEYRYKKGVEDGNDLLKTSTSQGGDDSSSVKTTNTVSVEDGGKTIKIGFSTGESKIDNADEAAKKIADNIIKQAGGKDIKSQGK